DSYLAERLELSRSRVVGLIEGGHVLLNGAAPRKREVPVAGDRVRVRVPAPEPSAVEAEAIPLDVVYEDADLLVIDKPAGMVVHPAPGHRSGTLVNALLHAVGDLSGIGGVLRPGIIHRLDKDTSGLLIVAKTDTAHRVLAEELRRRRVRRRYLTAAWGHLPEERFTVDAPMARNPMDRLRMAVVEGGRRAVTHFRRLERWPAADLLEAQLETGRTHQIRVHLLQRGHPVVGDDTYGKDRERGFSGASRGFALELAKRTPRQFLHAWDLRFPHPRSGEELRFRAPPPADLQAVIDWVRGADPGLA
ncbi:MAG: RluA family pseudouridine synthase, partial [Gemmatimonadetes bacterium]|nr:RluA family pseudouridine synthase [Gemmatimonadota bacterium]